MRSTWAVLLLSGWVGAAVPQGPAELRGLYRVAIPETLPEHPRVFVTPADLARIRTAYEAGEVYTVEAVNQAMEAARRTLDQPPAVPPTEMTVREAERLAIGQILSGDRALGEACRDRLLALAAHYPTLKTTNARGRLTDSTLGEGPVAISAAMAYDLLAASDILTAAERQTIEQGFLRPMAWECGHRCHHPNSSNWRSWALTIVASCGFAIGDRDLIEEAVNGVWDPDRELYLYGVVQQIGHSIFADGIHWERSMGYTYYTSSALMPVLEAAKNSGIDLWHAPIPSIMGPFPGSASHEEYGPEGLRSLRAFLDAPFYYAFPGGTFAQIGDSGSARLDWHPIYELAWEEYRDPKYAWLIRRHRESKKVDLAGWDVWRANGQPEGEARAGVGRGGSRGYWMKTQAGDRLALVQNVSCGPESVTLSAWVHVLSLSGGAVQLRANAGNQAWFSEALKTPGDWRQIAVTIPADPEGKPRNMRLHVFLQDGAGEVVWDDLAIEPAGVLVNSDLEAGPVDGRGTDFWSLVNGAADVPEGAWDLTQDATIGLNGQHTAGQTLFPVGGFAILRANAADPEAPAVLLEYGPYGSGHDHPDRLHISFFGLGEELCPDAGSWGYDNPMHVTWANQTMAHNTLTVDEVAQWPQGKSMSLWAGESGDRRAFGVLRLFHAGQRFQAVRATCDTVYDGVVMDRSLALRPYGLIDVFRATADQPHIYDLSLHGRGEVTPEGAAATIANPFEGLGYQHLTNLRQGPAATAWAATFHEADRSVQWLCRTLVPGTVTYADDPTRGRGQTAAILARQEGKSATWVSLIAPYRDEPVVTDLQIEREANGLVVTVTHRDGVDTLRFPDALTAPLRLSTPDGEEVAEP